MWCTTNTITVFQFQEETGQFQGDEIVSAREQSKAATFSKVVNKLWVLDAGSTKALHASYFHCLCLAQSIFFSKKMDDVQTQFGSFFFCACSGLAMGTMYRLQSSYRA
jgi:hypothetical protein